MEDEFKYARATGSLSAMTRFLIKDLEAAVALIDGADSYTIGSFKLTIKHAKQVLADAEESGAITNEIS